jgi:hypothetical protein
MAGPFPGLRKWRDEMLDWFYDSGLTILYPLIIILILAGGDDGTQPKGQK